MFKLINKYILFLVGIQITAGQNIRHFSSFQYNSFQHGIICNASGQPVKPTTLAEIQKIVQQALETGVALKPIGSLHSQTDIICTDGIPIDMHEIKHFDYNKTTGLARVGAGATLETLFEGIHNHGRTIYGIPAYNDITVGGALATSTHCTNLRNPATLSDHVVGIVVVDGLGSVRNITDRTTINAFRAHLGLLGILYEVTFSTVPQYKLQFYNYPESDNILRDENKMKHLIESNDHFQFFWFPTAKSVVISVGNRVSNSNSGNCQTHYVSEGSRAITASISKALETMQEEMDHLGFFVFQTTAKLSLYLQTPGRTPIYSDDGKYLKNPAVGFSHRMLSNKCIECVWNYGNESVDVIELAVVVPLSEFTKALKTMRGILKEYPMEFPLNGIYFRFLSSSEGLLSLNSGRQSVSIEWILIPRKDRYKKPMMGLSASQAMTQALIGKHGGRPHWAKHSSLYLQQPVLLKAYPHLPQFINLMNDFDPHGIFLNDFGRRLKYGVSKSSIDSYTPYCALADRCICQSDKDCGDGSQGSYLCGTIQGYRVCRENSTEYKAFRGDVVRNVFAKFNKNID